MNPDALVQEALKEDCPKDDFTTTSLGLSSIQGRARLVAKEDLVISGSELFTKTIRVLDSHAEIKWNFKNGDIIYKDQIVATIHGDLTQLLRTERVALNFLGHLSGVASLTRCFVKEVDGTDCQILDTRKTTPGYRNLEKQAVCHGGGQNHRFHLSHTILIKENHIYLTGDIQTAIGRIKKHSTHPQIAIEVTNVSCAKMAVEAGATRLLLDNMSNQSMLECIKDIPSEIIVEASGNMKLDRVRSVAELGVHYISVGALTHSPPCADFSLQFYGQTQ